ncbi:hypothetical protein FACS1894171_0810 [Clostridia bacterium]|nr:hypothetical protein FACS1894171_0810 [Clostridia bacterium]
MRENLIRCDKFDFITILDVTSRKAVNEHSTLHIKGHVAADDEYVLRAAGQNVAFTASGSEGDKLLFNGLISGIDIFTENDVRILSVSVVSNSSQMDIARETRTFQDSNMTYQAVTNHMMEKNQDFNFIWPSDGEKPIGSMTVQYQETDWQYCRRLAGRLGTVVVPDYLLKIPHISIGMLERSAKQGINALSYTAGKDVRQFRDDYAAGGFSECDAVYYVVKSHEIFDLCDPIPFQGLSLYVYAIDTKYEGNELVHFYTLKEANGFYTKQTYNENLIGVSLRGTVKEVREDTVRVEIAGDVEQPEYKWFPYATPFSQPDGYGWYFMPEIGDEIRLQFPSEKEYDAYVSSAVHITHGNRLNPETKFIRTIYGQILQFDPDAILIDDGAGSSITLKKNQGISMETDKAVDIDARSDITVSAAGKVLIAGQGGVVMQKNGSVVSVDDAIDISSEHTRVQ